jgi:hypothetical protein
MIMPPLAQPPSRWRRVLHRLGLAQGGGIAVEFAVALPVLVALMLGVVEISRFTYLNQKLGRTTSTVADLIARAASISESDLRQIFLAAEEVASPFELGDRAVVIVTSITRPVGSNATIAWQRSGVGSLSATSKVGAEGGRPTLGEGFVLGEGETVIVAETYFDFEPLLGGTILGAQTLYTRSHHRARKSTLASIDSG